MAKHRAERPISAMDKKYQTENDLRTIKEAEEIKASKPRLNAAKSLARQEAKALNKISKRK